MIGGAYVFSREGTSWSQQKLLIAADGATGDAFGYWVSISGKNILLGAYGDESDTGAAYVCMSALPVLTTSAATSISSSSVVTGGELNSSGTTPITDRGVCYGTSPSPSQCVSAGSSTNPFSVILSGLLPSTTYYIRAYATNNSGASTVYGDDQTFITASSGTAASSVPLRGGLLLALTLAATGCAVLRR